MTDIQQHVRALSVDRISCEICLTYSYFTNVTYKPGQVADACECGNEPSGSMKCGEFLD